MQKISAFNLCAVVLAFLALSAGAAKGQALDNRYAIDDFARNELVFLQEALALEGYFKGAARGNWGSISNRSLEAFADEINSESEQRFNPLDGIVIGSLALGYLADRVDHDIGYVVLDDVDIGIVVPYSSDFLTRQHRTVVTRKFGDIEAMTSTLRERDFQAYLATNESSFVNPASAYISHKETYKISAGRDMSAHNYIIGYRRNNSSWSVLHLKIPTTSENYPLYRLASSSVRSRPESYRELEAESLLGGLMEEVLALLTASEDPASQGSPDNKQKQELLPSGSGFFVNSSGEFLTNHHVIEICGDVSVAGVPYTVLDSDEVLDVAILAPLHNAPRDFEVAKFAFGAPKLNQSILAAGFPLQGITEGLSVTRGEVSRVPKTGHEFQFTAPVNPGNSGGPVLLNNGAVIGQVTARVTQVGEQVALGMSFGTKAADILQYLDYIGVEYWRLGKNTLLDELELAEVAQGITGSVACQ